MAKKARISIVGAGPGSPEYVTPIARATVQSAQVVIGAARVLELFEGDIESETITLVAKNMNDVLKQAVDFALEGKNVVVLSTGDPGFSGLLKTFLKATMGREVGVNVIPGISSIQVCAARLTIPWDEMRLFTFHDSASINEKEELLENVKKSISVMLLPDVKSFAPAEIAKFLIENGVEQTTPAFVCENLTLSDERISGNTLNDLLAGSFGSLCVMVINPS
jgi:cobalt-precorrin-7 (C5)-methyltransferase